MDSDARNELFHAVLKSKTGKSILSMMRKRRTTDYNTWEAGAADVYYMNFNEDVVVQRRHRGKVDFIAIPAWFWNRLTEDPSIKPAGHEP